MSESLFGAWALGKTELVDLLLIVDASLLYTVFDE